jgi:GSH-dependent disulfide-bond oxidoreductase
LGEPLTLYGMSSPNVRKVVIALEEIGLPYRTRHVAVFRGRQFEEDFLALNPMAKVPVILDPSGPAGEVPIFESGAILVYLAESYAPQFLPVAGPARWEVLEWLMLQVAQVGPALGQHSHFRLQAEANPYAATRYRHMAAQVYRVLERRLGEAEWLGGAAYSIADMATYPWARYLKRHGMDLAEFPLLEAWKARIAWGDADYADRTGATPEQRAMFAGLHIPAPDAQAAATYRGQTERRNRERRGDT